MNIFYAICCTSRTGSTYLCELLQSTGVLGRPAEYLNTDAAHEPEWRKRLEISSDATLPEYLAALTDRRSTSNGVFGVKLTIDNMRRLHDVRRPTHYVYLRRRDTLRQAISLYRAWKSGQWVKYCKGPRDKQVPFDREKIVHLRRAIHDHNRQWQAWFEERDVQPCRLWYDDLTADPRGAVVTIARHLGCLLNDSVQVQANTLMMRDDVTQRWVKMLTDETEK